MTMMEMDNLLFKHADSVARKYNPMTRKYKYTLTKSGLTRHYMFEYPNGVSEFKKQCAQVCWLDKVIKDFTTYVRLNTPKIEFTCDNKWDLITEYLKNDIDTVKEVYTMHPRNTYGHMLDRISPMAIKKVIFNAPATIVLWKDGTKTVVKAENEEFDPEKGLAMAIAKKAMGNKGNYFNEIKKWVKSYEEAVEKEAEEILNSTNIQSGVFDDFLTPIKNAVTNHFNKEFTQADVNNCLEEEV